jgi:hypothetical protein
MTHRQGKKSEEQIQTGPFRQKIKQLMGRLKCKMTGP